MHFAWTFPGSCVYGSEGMFPFGSNVDHVRQKSIREGAGSSVKSSRFVFAGMLALMGACTGGNGHGVTGSAGHGAAGVAGANGGSAGDATGAAGLSGVAGSAAGAP